MLKLPGSQPTLYSDLTHTSAWSNSHTRVDTYMRQPWRIATTSGFAGPKPGPLEFTISAVVQHPMLACNTHCCQVVATSAAALSDLAVFMCMRGTGQAARTAGSAGRR